MRSCSFVAPSECCDPNARTGKGKRAEREAVVQPSAILADLAASNTNSHDPYAEPSTGLAAAPSLGRARERELAEMDSYEETNMTRLFQTKRAAKRRREDEARRSGAAPRAGFADLDDFVGALDKNAKRSGGEYETLRSAKRARPEASAGEAGSLKSSGGARSAYKKKGSFTRKLQKASGARGGKR